jgi:AcrR family transcriptional regulator
MRGRPRVPIVLTSTERTALRRLAGDDTTEVARRANIVLLSASGLANTDVATQVGVDAKTVSKWRRKFIEDRVDGLVTTAPSHPAPPSSADDRSGRPRVHTEVANDALVTERRAVIIKAAVELFRRKGYGSTSVSEIAELAGLPIGTLYRYVSKKSDILYLLALDLMPPLIGAIEGALASHDTVEDKLRYGIRSYIEAIAQRRTHIKVMYWDTHWLAPDEQAVLKVEEGRTRELFEGVLEEGIAQGVVRPVNVLVAAQNIILTGHAWALKGFLFRDAISLDDYIEEQVDLLTRGLLRSDLPIGQSRGHSGA